MDVCLEIITLLKMGYFHVKIKNIIWMIPNSKSFNKEVLEYNLF